MKTRLAAQIGSEAAAGLAEAMLSDVWQTLCSVAEIRPILAASEEGPFPDVLRSAEIWLQGEGDLGARLERIFRRGLQSAPVAMAIGADSPQLCSTHICRALAELEDHDAVIGPSPDGGYYLLGLKRCPPGLLVGLPWSTPETRQQTEARLAAERFSVASLDPLADVDVADDLSALIHHLRQAPNLAPHTKAWIALRSLHLG